MINISRAVADIFFQDDVALAAARRGWLNLSSYARHIQPAVQTALLKEASEGSIVTALSRITASLPAGTDERTNVIQNLAVHANLEGVSYERSERVSEQIRQIYHQVKAGTKTFLTVTQGINEITIVAETEVARMFRAKLDGTPRVYLKEGLVGITAKFAPYHLETPNLIYSLVRRLAYKNVNLVEIVSTATELTFIIDKRDLATALEQLQKDI
jgi:aspartokinase